MEWANNLQGYSPFEEPLNEFNPPPPPLPLPPPETMQEPFVDQPRVGEWTYEENKMFERALSEFSSSSPMFYENLASRIPTKTIDDIMVHYQALVDDVELIESGRIPLPEYKDACAQGAQETEEEDEEENDMIEEKKNDGETLATPTPQKEENPKNKGKKPVVRKKCVLWTHEEHQLFLMGLNKYGKGDWKSISRYYVITKTPTQVASHAQKFFRRQMRLTKPKKHRPSIHDVNTVNPIPTIMNYNPSSVPIKPLLIAANNLLNDVPALPEFISTPVPTTDPNPMFLNPGFIAAPTIDTNPMFPNPNINGGAAINPNPNPTFFSMPSSSSSAALPYAADDFVDFQNACPACLSSASYWVPPYGNNQPWG